MIAACSSPTRRRAWKAKLSLDFHERQRVLRDALRRSARRAEAAVPDGASVCHAIVVHPPGGIAGGDERLARARCAKEARSAADHDPGARKWYRSAGLGRSQDAVASTWGQPWNGCRVKRSSSMARFAHGSPSTG
jgi:urease accessory protein